MKNNIIEKLLKVEDRTRIKVRFDDTDMMGIVHFKNYMVYFDDGFVSFMNSVFGGVANTFGIPVWLTTFIGLFVTILIGFGIFTVIFQREV